MFKKQKVLLLIICSVVITLGYSSIATAQVKDVTTTKDKQENQKILNSLLDNSSLTFTHPSGSDEYRKMANELDVIISNDRYDLLIWYINTYLSDNKTALKDKYSSYDEFKTVISDIFPDNRFSTQLDINSMEGLQSSFYSLMLQSYEHQYLSSLTDKQKKIIEKEREAWIKYKGLSMDTFYELHVANRRSGSMGSMFKSNYSTHLDDQYYGTILSCSFDNNDLGSTAKVDNKLIKSAPKYFKKYLMYIGDYSKKSTDKVISTLNAELKAWNEWIKIRESYSKNGLNDKNCAYDYYTEKLKKQKLVDLRNAYENYANSSASYGEIFLKNNSTMEDIINYNLIEAIKSF